MSSSTFETLVSRPTSFQIGYNLRRSLHDLVGHALKKLNEGFLIGLGGEVCST